MCNSQKAEVSKTYTTLPIKITQKILTTDTFDPLELIAVTFSLLKMFSLKQKCTRFFNISEKTLVKLNPKRRILEGLRISINAQEIRAKLFYVSISRFEVLTKN